MQTLLSRLQSQHMLGGVSGLHDDLLVGHMDNPYRAINYRTVDEIAGALAVYHLSQGVRLRRLTGARVRYNCSSVV